MLIFSLTTFDMVFKILIVIFLRFEYVSELLLSDLIITYSNIRVFQNHDVVETNSPQIRCDEIRFKTQILKSDFTVIVLYRNARPR